MLPHAPAFSQFGSASLIAADSFWIAAFNANFPARLAATAEGITLRVLWHRYELRRSDIRGIRRYGFLFTRGIKILHTVPGYPSPLVFWPVHLGRLCHALEELGYNVTEDSANGSASRTISNTSSPSYSRLGGAWLLATGSLWIGAFAVTWPLARFTATSEGITLRVLWSEFALRRADIQEIRKYRFLYGTGIRILHTVVGYPRVLVFWPVLYRRLARELEALGYTIS